MAIELEKLLHFAIKNNGSDLILTVGCPPSLRVDGTVRNISKRNLEKSDTQNLLKSLLKASKQQELDELGSTDFSMSFQQEAYFRGNVFRQQGHYSIVLRYLPNRLIEFNQLKLPTEVLSQVSRPRGLVLVTGPTGSGKSSTLGCLLNHINENFAKHILTIEDPIETKFTSKKSIFNQREVGEDVPSFSEALRRALRQDPDVIMVGEMRDLETIQTALRAAETGHLVMSTLHTRSASDTISRIIDAFPTDQQSTVRSQLASSLNMIISQNLVKKNGGGRVLASEVMILSHAMRHLIRDNRIHQIDSSIETSKGKGCRLFDSHLCDLTLQGLITEESAFTIAADPSSFKVQLSERKNSNDYWINAVETGEMSQNAALAACPNPKSLQLALKNA